MCPINDDVGGFEGIRNTLSRENHVLLKGDYRVTSTSNFAITYTRLRPYGLDPAIDPANDRTYNYTQDRFTGSYTMGRSSWTSESRFGFNANTMARLDQYFLLKDPRNIDGAVAVGPKSAPPERLGLLRFQRRLRGDLGHGRPDLQLRPEGGTRQPANIPSSSAGDYGFNGGFRSNPENPNISFQNKADFLANIPSSGHPDFRFAFV